MRLLTLPLLLGALVLTIIGQACGHKLEDEIHTVDVGGISPYHPRCNPLALFGSGIGHTLADWCEDQMDTAFHFGLGNPIRNTQTLPGNFLASLYKGTQPNQHEHAVRIDKITENTLEKTRRFASAARTEGWVKWAFYLQPTNIDAYDAYVYIIMTDPRPFRAGEKGHKNAIALTEYVQGLYRTNLPNDLIGKGNAEINLWLLKSQEIDHKGTTFHELTRQTEERMKHDIDQASLIIGQWKATGQWNQLGAAERTKINDRLAMITRFQIIYQKHVEQWDKEKSQKTNLTVPSATPKKH